MMFLRILSKRLASRRRAIIIKVTYALGLILPHSPTRKWSVYCVGDAMTARAAPRLRDFD